LSAVDILGQVTSFPPLRVHQKLSVVTQGTLLQSGLVPHADNEPGAVLLISKVSIGLFALLVLLHVVNTLVFAMLAASLRSAVHLLRLLAPAVVGIEEQVSGAEHLVGAFVVALPECGAVLRISKEHSFSRPVGWAMKALRQRCASLRKSQEGKEEDDNLVQCHFQLLLLVAVGWIVSILGSFYTLP